MIRIFLHHKGPLDPLLPLAEELEAGGNQVRGCDPWVHFPLMK